MRRDDTTIAQPPANDRPGDRWMCGRAGDPDSCVHGPSVNGACPLASACRPKLTWAGRRRRIGICALVLFAVLMLLIIQPGVSPSVFKPGELSTPHAQILAGTMDSARCATCHHPQSISPTQWSQAARDGHQNISLTDRCLDCHHTMIDRDLAKSAHNLPGHLRDQLRSSLRLASANPKSWHDSMPGPAMTQDDVGCAACHREHRGAGASLLDVSDAQCQTCHADRFGDFASSHPDWDRWPYGRGGAIAFDHSTHMNKHFPATGNGSAATVFDCKSCHQQNAAGEIARSPGYESCQQCHDDALRIEAAQGFDLVTIPSIPANAAERIGVWPAAATGFADGRIAPLAELLLRRDERMANAIRSIPQRDFSRLEPADSEANDALMTAAIGQRELLQNLSTRGHAYIIDEADAAGISPDAVAALIRMLPPQLIRDAYDRWFAEHRQASQANLPGRPNTGVRQVDFDSIGSLPPRLRLAARVDDDLLLPDDQNDSDLLSDDPLLDDGDLLLGGDPLSAEDPLASVPQSDVVAAAGAGFDPDQMLPEGGWYRDDLRLSIRYRGGGHDDTVLRSLIQIAAELPSGDPVRKRLLASRAVSACISCHPSATSMPATSTPATWHSEPLIGRPSDFTKFAHKPHLNVSKLGDCTHCHQVNTAKPAQVSFVSSKAVHHEFKPLQRASCAACHTTAAAGESCVDCHRYHIRR